MSDELLTPRERKEHEYYRIAGGWGYNLDTLLEAQLAKADPQGYYNAGFEQGKFEERERWQVFSRKCLDLAHHGDYSNGVEAFGIDEGIIQAKDLLYSLEAEWQTLRGEGK